MFNSDKSTRRQELYALLGDLPSRDYPISSELVGEEDRGSYILELLTLDLNGLEPVPAFFARPKNSAGRRPVVLYNHAHGGDYRGGKREFIEPRGAFQDPPYAQALTSMGCAALCIDAWNFGERCGRVENQLFKEMLWNGQVLWGMMVYDSIRALDYLVSREDVDPDRIGTLGLSMGSTMAWWVAALDERVAVTIDLCCLTDFHELIAMRGLDGHGIYYYVPNLLKQWTTARINALIAPRPHLSLAGNYDLLTPPRGLDRIDEELQLAYEQEGAPDAWRLVRYPCGHQETADMRRQSLEWLHRWLLG